jgi:hypothetical protein
MIRRPSALWLIAVVIALSSLPHPALSTNISTADPSYPASYADIDSEPLRTQFDALINDIDNLWAAIGPNFLEANQVLAALVSGKAVGLPIPSCFGLTNALTWRPGLGFGCNDIEATGRRQSGASAFLYGSCRASWRFTGDGNVPGTDGERSATP